jgi:hypothetical protein
VLLEHLERLRDEHDRHDLAYLGQLLQQDDPRHAQVFQQDEALLYQHDYDVRLRDQLHQAHRRHDLRRVQ